MKIDKTTALFGAMAILAVAAFVALLYDSGEIGYDENQFPPSEGILIKEDIKLVGGENLKIKLGDVSINTNCQMEGVGNRVYKFYTKNGKSCQIWLHSRIPVWVDYNKTYTQVYAKVLTITLPGEPARPSVEITFVG